MTRVMKNVRLQFPRVRALSRVRVGSRGPEVMSKAPLAAATIDQAIRATRPAIGTAIVFSFFINMLGLAGPIYMLQVYDRVLGSRNISTLVALTIILTFLYAVLSSLEMLRTNLLIRAGVLFDNLANPVIFRAVQWATLRHPDPRHVQSLRDVDSIREFYTGAGLIAFCDFPWVPIYILAATALHPLFGILAIGGSIITFTLAFANEKSTRSSLDQASRNALAANNHAVTTFRNSEVIQAMGMLEMLRRRWSKHHEAVLGWQASASNKAGVLIALIKLNRMLMQSLVLGVGAYLAIMRITTPGIMIAASIIVGRALAPVEVAVGNWKTFVGMREAYRRVTGLLSQMPNRSEQMDLPRPSGQLALENVFVRAPGREAPVLKNVSVNMAAGTVLGVIGPSAAGKSSLARAIVGVWPTVSGTVRLDGADLNHWDADALGKYIGYLPQDVELFSGNIAENISRFTEGEDSKAILEAAILAGVHDMIQRLPDGYNTQIGESGQALSGGQRQRIGLARALYGLAPLIVLDEPNSNLDGAGESALIEAIIELKKAARTVIIITHKTNILSIVDYIMVMNDGAVQTAGPRESMLAAIRTPRDVSNPAPAKDLTKKPSIAPAA